MFAFLRSARLFWVLGVLLLIGTVAGAGWMLNNGNGEAPAVKNTYGVSIPFEGKGIVSIGYVDVEPGVAQLYPTQVGRVVWVADEGAVLAKGEPVLRLDDELARIDLKRAELALEDAKLQHEEAKNLTTKHKLEMEAQQEAINALQAEKAAAQKQLAKLEDRQKKGLGGTEFDVDAANQQLKKVESLIKAEEKKLAILKELGPEEKIERARLDVEAKEELKKKAKKALDEYTVVAPTEGTVLRVFTSVGETLGPNPKAPAVEFCPNLPRIVRAEVLQEWADGLQKGQEVVIEDDTTSAHQWKGKVAHVSDWYTHKRSIIQEPFQFNDVRTLECIIHITEVPAGKKLRIGQRMRVMINQGGP
jgi:multidrug resistance efflux pump